MRIECGAEALLREAEGLGNHEFDRGVTEMLRQVNGEQSTIHPSITIDPLNFALTRRALIAAPRGW